MPSADHHLLHYDIFGCVLLLSFDLQIGNGSQQLGVECADLLTADVMRAPGLVVVASRLSKGLHDSVKAVLVFLTNVPINNPEPSGDCPAGIWDFHLWSPPE